jgi:hypothetical protein
MHEPLSCQNCGATRGFTLLTTTTSLLKDGWYVNIEMQCRSCQHRFNHTVGDNPEMEA